MSKVFGLKCPKSIMSTQFNNNNYTKQKSRKFRFSNFTLSIFPQKILTDVIANVKNYYPFYWIILESFSFYIFFRNFYVGILPPTLFFHIRHIYIYFYRQSLYRQKIFLFLHQFYLCDIFEYGNSLNLDFCNFFHIHYIYNEFCIGICKAIYFRIV